MREYLSRLNEEQILPVQDTQGPVLVIAGAGSGKTRVLTSRIIYLIENELALPSEILAITFTNKAANEMKERLEKEIDSFGMWICTIHSMCVRILRADGDKLGFNKDFSIYAESDKDIVLRKIIREKEIQDSEFLKELKSIISFCKSNGISPLEYKKDNCHKHNVSVIVECFQLYQEHLKKFNAMDFDDLLNYCEELLTRFPDVREKYSSRFKYIHVDEFQDTNATQYKIVKMLAYFHNNIFVVGDDDQSIYGWRGADVGNILDFEYDFKGAKVYKLQRNYRSTKKILSLANRIIANNVERKSKRLWTENEEGDDIKMYLGADEIREAEFTAHKIRDLVDSGKKYSDFAVLMRLNALSRAYEQEFLKYGIPYRVFGGFKFYERKEIKDLTAYVRLLVNPLDNEAIMRIINTPKRGIGDKIILDLNEYADSLGMTLFDAIFEVEDSSLAKGAKQKVSAFKSLIVELLVDKETKPISELIKAIIDKTMFLSQFDESSDEGINKRQNIDEFISSVEEFEKLNPTADLNDFLSSITLSSDTDDLDEGDFVTIATIHSVKGLEFDTVFVGGVEENIFPVFRATQTDKELEEERRLMYVAVTRAKSKLFITRAETRYLYGTRQRMGASRFLTECGLIQKKKPVEKPVETAFERKNGYSDITEREATTSYGSTTFGRSFSRPQPVKQTTSVDFGKFKTGKLVKHAKFGVGTIIQCKNSGENLIVDVAFKGIGIKSLSAKFAPMTVLD